MMKVRFPLHQSLAALVLAGCSSEPAQPEPTMSASAEASAQSNDEALAEATPIAVTSSETPPFKVRSYPPSDACTGLPGWPAFRKSLDAAVAKRDAQSLSELSAPDIRLDFGGGDGIAELHNRLADPDMQLWQELDEILSLGCSTEGGLAAMPAIFWQVPDDVDGYAAMLLIGDKIPAFRDSNGRGKPLVFLDWQLVEIEDYNYPDEGDLFTKVTLPDGKTKAYVETRKLRSLLDYRLIAEPKDGQWQITAFIAGD